MGHSPVEFKVGAENETSVRVDVSGPLFNDPGPPPAPSGSPCPELWEYEGKVLIPVVYCNMGHSHTVSSEKLNTTPLNKEG